MYREHGGGHSKGQQDCPQRSTTACCVKSGSLSAEDSRQANRTRPPVGSFLAAQMGQKLVKWRAPGMMARFVREDPSEPGDGHPLVAGQAPVQSHAPLAVGHKGLCVARPRDPQDVIFNLREGRPKSLQKILDPAPQSFVGQATQKLIRGTFAQEHRDEATASNALFKLQREQRT